MKTYTMEETTKFFWFEIFFFVLGITTGIFVAKMISPAEKEFVMDYFSKYLLINTAREDLYTQIFYYSFFNNISLLFIIAISGFILYGFVLSFSTLAFKGFVLGFTVSLILDSMGLKGIFLILVSVFPQNIIFICALFYGVAVSLARKGESTRNYLLTFFVLSLITVLGCLLESFLGPILTRLVL